MSGGKTKASTHKKTNKYGKQEARTAVNKARKKERAAKNRLKREGAAA